MNDKRKEPKITVIGGGTGLPILLSGLKEVGSDVTAVVTVSDDGGSSGSIRGAINTIPPGDIRNCMIALSDMSPLYKEIFQYRFAPEDKEFSGHAIGNLIIAAMSEMKGSVYNALKFLSLAMDVQGKVLPACEEPLVLQAHYANGDVIEGETKIVTDKHPIEYVSVRIATEGNEQHKPKAGRGVVEAIEEADVIVLGPGSLYTSILPNLAIEEIKSAIHRTKATVIYVCNIMTQLGETEYFSDADHVRIVNEHLGGQEIDVALINETTVPKSYIEHNDTQDYLVQVLHDHEALMRQRVRLLEADFLNLKESGVYHNKKKLVEGIMNVYHHNL